MLDSQGLRDDMSAFKVAPCLGSFSPTPSEPVGAILPRQESDALCPIGDHDGIVRRGVASSPRACPKTSMLPQIARLAMRPATSRSGHA